MDNIIKNNKDCKFISERVSAKKNINIKVLFDKILKEYFNEEFNQKVKQKLLEDGVSFKVKKKKKARKEDGNCC